MGKTKYGIISDIHKNPRVVPFALEVLKEKGAEKLIVNGDLGDDPDSMAYTIDSIGKSGLEAYIHPGSHERLSDYEPAIEFFTEKYPNIVSTLLHQKIENNGYHLVFLPGSDLCCRGNYIIDDPGERASGFYRTKDGPIRLINMQDLRKLVTAPDKTVLVCHVPRKFDSLEYGVDVTNFGEANLEFILGGKRIPAGAIFPIEDAYKILLLDGPVIIRHENRGNEALRELYDELGISKAINGHFHESVQRATDKNGVPVNQGEPLKELFWNASCLDRLKVGVLSAEDENISYENLNLREFIRF